ncbi:xyn11C [Xylariomycetidae sp. FL0641]|nr:xyn11C [Xylariomycetidae sp. FL0641]
MLSKVILATVLLVQGVLSAPVPDDAPRPVEELIARGNERRQGYYWSFWQEGSGSHNCQQGSGGSYTAKWSGGGGFVCGKGWSYGGNRAVKYSGTYEPEGPGYLSVYGWTRNPLIEYYIMDAHGDLEPNEPWTEKGNFTTEEGTYTVYTSTRTNKPSIVGTATFQQYWSVRTEQRIGGTITTGDHFDAWNSFGMKLGGHDYMILATEGYANGDNTASGSSSITLS